MSNLEQARITDESIALDFRRAHQDMQEAAISVIRDEGGIPAGNPDAVVRFSGETHDIAIQVREEDIAPRGLAWLRRKSVTVEARATVTDHAQPDQPPVELYLNALRSGRHHLLDPQLTGSFVTPMSMEGDWPEGTMAGRLQYTKRIMAHQQPPVVSMQTLSGAVNAVLGANTATLAPSVEGVGEAQSNIEFIGTEWRRAHGIITPFMEAIGEQHGQHLRPSTLRMVAEKTRFTTLQLTNELSDPTTDCPITVSMDRLETSIALQPSGAWEHLPALRVVCSTSGDAQTQSFVFLDAQNRVHPLTRAQRQDILLLLQEKLGDTAAFDRVKGDYDLQLPDESVLDACEQLLGDAPTMKDYTLTTGEGENASSVRIWLQRQDDHFMGVMQKEGTAPSVISFGARHFSIDTMPPGTPTDPKDILTFYDLLRQLADPDHR
jgi:hypothetical protein